MGYRLQVTLCWMLVGRVWVDDTRGAAMLSLHATDEYLRPTVTGLWGGVRDRELRGSNAHAADANFIQ